MTQSDFAKWLESVLGDAPMEELVSDEVREHMDRVFLANEERAWNFAREEARQSYEVALRSLCKMMFIVGYDAGREQAQMDNLFGGGSGLDDDGIGDNNGDGNNSDDSPKSQNDVDGAMQI